MTLIFRYLIFLKNYAIKKSILYMFLQIRINKKLIKNNSFAKSIEIY